MLADVMICEEQHNQVLAQDMTKCAAYEQTKTTVNNPRLIIKKIVLKDFKSYAGIVSIGPFHKSFSAIVGPNGSGKSNIIDALLFVFGFRAKKLRHERLSHLIHKSNIKSNTRSCYVEVHFEKILDLPYDDDGFEVVPDTLVFVKRSVEKPSERGPERSQYFINNRPKTYAEVTAHLKEEGIDLEYKRFLILQGEVESISLMKAKGAAGNEDGLLEYIEDIIGTSHYKKKVEESREQLDEIDFRRDQMITKVKLAETERDELNKKSKRAFEYIMLCNELTVKKVQLYSIAVLDCKDKMDECRQKSIDINKTLEGISQKKTFLQASINEQKVKLHEYQKKLTEFENEFSRSKQELQEHEHKEIQVNEAFTHLNSKKAKLERDIDDNNATLTSCTSWLEGYEKKEEEILSSTKELSSQYLAERKILDKETAMYKAATKHIQLKIDEVRQKMSPWLQNMDRMKAELEMTISKKKTIEERLNLSANKLTESKKKTDSIQIELNNKKTRLDQMKCSLQETNHEIELLKNKIMQKTSLEKELSTLVETLETQMSDMLNAQQKIQHRGRIHAALQNQAKLGNITGICVSSLGNFFKTLMMYPRTTTKYNTFFNKFEMHMRIPKLKGRLGDLGVIDNIYNTAVTTACSALDNMVVDSVSTAQRCIEFIRKENLGRTTFICLDKLQIKAISKSFTPENTPRLYDLITPLEPKYADAFYQVLRETLVCENLDQAMRIAYGKKRYRVVTLQGQLLDVSGIISGCGSPKKGGMKLRSDSTNIANSSLGNLEEVQNKITSTKSHLNKVSLELKDYLLRLDKYNVQFSETNFEISKLSMEIAALNRELESLNSYIKELSSGYIAPKPTDKKDITLLSEKQESINSKITELKLTIDEYQSQISDLEMKAEKAGGKQLAEKTKALDEIKLKMNNSEYSLSKLKAELKSRRSQLTKTKSALKENEIELKSINTALQKSSKEIEEIQPVLTTLRLKLDELSTECRGCQDLVNKASSAINMDIDEVQDLEKTEINKRRLLENVQEGYITYERRCEHYKKEISTLELIPTRKNDGLQEIPVYTREQLMEMNPEEIQADITKLKGLCKEDVPNLNVVVEYEQKCKLYDARARQLEELNIERSQKIGEYGALSKERLDQFMEGFTVISKYLKEIYQLITMGGNAELEPVDSLDPFSEGIAFSVMPPKKSWKNICNLSGGEKTLSSLALVFALHRYKPAPLYFMDEVDAALDFRNVSIIANYIKERTKNAQFIVVSLRNNMYELSNRLVGVYKYENEAKSVVFDPSSLIKSLQKEVVEVQQDDML